MTSRQLDRIDGAIQVADDIIGWAAITALLAMASAPFVLLVIGTINQ